ncbi:MAG: response regulator transcription factor [Chloroflexi bacterium]|nr:response regulator transcription factor [Chloroflexota bacterium]
MSDRTRVVIVDDHPLFREGVAHTLVAEPDLEVVGQGVTAEDALHLARDLLPEIILLDIAMPGGGLNAAQTIATACPVTKIVMLTVSEEEEDVLAALKAGARAYILKGVSARELVSILRAVAVGEVYVSPKLAGRLLLEMTGAWPESHHSTGLLVDLTERERQILEQVADGCSNKEIGHRLHLSEKTVKHYMTNILQKLQVRNRVEAALLAQRAGRLEHKVRSAP